MQNEGEEPRDHRPPLGGFLRLLPASFRDSFEDEIAGMLRADYRVAQQRGRLAVALFWWHSMIDLISSSVREHLSDLRMDLRFIVRSLLKAPVFTLCAILSLAIGIGATTSVYAIFEATFGRGIPGVGDGSGQATAELINVKPLSEFEEGFLLTSYPTFADLRDSGVLDDLAGFNGRRMSFSTSDGSEPELLGVQLVTDNYFSVLDVAPMVGRLLEPGDEAEGKQVAVISSQLWRDRFGADEKVVGREMKLNGKVFEVIGVAGDGFRGHFVGFGFDVFLSTAMNSVAGLPALGERDARWIEMVGRKSPELSLEQVKAGFDLSAAGLRERWPEIHRGLGIEVERCTGIDADLRGGLAGFLTILAAVALFVLLIACVNVANLMLGRLLQRRREMTVRLALGAPRSRLVRQLLTEALLLALIGGALGAALTLVVLRLASGTLPAFSGVTLDLRADGSVFLVTLLISLVAAMSFGWLPALESTRGAHRLSRGSDHSGGSKLRSALVVGQVALSAIVLVSAGLFLRAFERASNLDPGFDMNGVTVMHLDPTQAGFDRPESVALIDELVETARQLPGVDAAGLTASVPLSLGARFFPNTVELQIRGHEPPVGRDGFGIEHAVVSPGYLDAMGITIENGRDFDERDRDDSRGVVMVNQTFAERFFPAEHGDASPALGQILVADDRELEVVAVVEDSRYRTLDEAAMPFVYLAWRQFPGRRGNLLVRSGSAAGIVPDLRAVVRQRAPELPISELGPLNELLAVSLLPQKVASAVSGALGLVGLLLTAIGLYGVLGYRVRARSAEIGLRMSLGAEPRAVLALILRFGLRLTALGLLVGLPLAGVVARFLTSFLYGLSPWDPTVYALIAGVLGLTALIASYSPARRAARIDPLKVLRSE